MAGTFGLDPLVVLDADTPDLLIRVAAARAWDDLTVKRWKAARRK